MTDQPTTPTNEAAPTVADTTRPTAGAVPYSRFKAVNDGLRTLQAQLPDLQAKVTQVDDLRQQIAGLELQMYQQDVARDFGLPAEYVPYIAGDSKADIAAKAAGLVAAIPGLGKTPPPAFTPGEVSDKGWYSRNRARVLRTMGLDG
jgi:hypothetical protein